MLGNCSQVVGSSAWPVFCVNSHFLKKDAHNVEQTIDHWEILTGILHSSLFIMFIIYYLNT